MKLTSFWQLVIVKVRLNLVSEASHSYLNYAWWILEPVLFVGVFYLVFGVLLDRGGPDFVAFLVCGQIPFLWYSHSISNSSNSILAGRTVISQIDIAKAFFPIVVMLQDAVKQLIVFALLLLFLVTYGIDVTVSWLYLPLVVVVQALFILASGLVAAAIVPVIPDFKYVITTGLMLLMFASGTFYSYRDVVEPRYQEVFLSNPMAALIKSYRQVLLDGATPDFGQLTIVALVSCLVAVTVSIILRRYSGAYSRLVLQ